MVHLRIVAPEAEAKKALALFEETDSVYNVIVLEGVARKPQGHAILCDVAREDASVVIADLKEIGIHKCGSIAVEDIDSQISDVAIAAEKAARGLPSDAVVWEEVESRTSENVELSAQLPGVHGRRDPDCGRWHPDRPDHPDHRGDGRRARSSVPSRACA